MDIINLIKVHDFASSNIESLESAIQSAEIKNEKDKVNFGNLCIALHGFRMIADATQAMLKNEDTIKNNNGKFYKKVEIVTPPENNGAGKDFNEDRDLP